MSEYVVRCESKNGQKEKEKDTCFIEIGLHAQNMLTILGSIANAIGSLI